MSDAEQAKSGGEVVSPETYPDLYRLVDAVDPAGPREQFLLPDLGARGVAQAVHNHLRGEQCTFHCPAHYAGGTFMSETDSTHDLVEVYRDGGGDLRWRFKDASNDEPMADGSQGYSDRRDVMNGIRRVTGRIPTVVQGKSALPNITSVQIAVVYV